VPLYTLLQHRAPKESKGSLVATSNFFNVTGGIVAAVVFFVVTAVLQSVHGTPLTYEKVQQNHDLISAYQAQLAWQAQIPRLLFVCASLITAGVLALLCFQRPDFPLRGVSWLRSGRRRHLRALGLDNIPANGQIILICNCRDFDHWVYVVST